MYKYTPKPNRRPGIILSATLFFTAAALLAPLSSDIFILLLLRSVALWAFFLGYVTLERYVFTSYSYIIEENENIPGKLDLKIVSKRYARLRVVCRVSLDSVKDIRKLEKNERPSPPRSVKKYNYCPDMAGKNRYWLFLEDGGEAAVKFCPDETVVNIIKNAINHK